MESDTSSRTLLDMSDGSSPIPLGDGSWKESDGRSTIAGPRLAALASGILGVQMFWSILMAHGTPYLQSLGFPPALVSLVWMAGPLGGFFIQPLMGMWTDGFIPQPGSLFEGFGRRKPFIITGAIGIVVCLLALANVKEGCEFLALALGSQHEDVKTLFEPQGAGSSIVIALAIGWVYALNVAVQPLQIGVRAFVVDCVPAQQQDEASAWISRWNCFGAIFTFWLGSVDLPARFPFLGHEHFKALTIIEAFVVAVTIPVSLLASRTLTELSQTARDSTVSIWNVLPQLWRAWKLLPRTTAHVLRVQFWAWLAWFPFLYYHTIWVGHLAYEESKEAPFALDASKTSSTHSASSSRHQMSAAQAAQAGSFASFIFAFVSLGFTILLPLVARYIRAFTLQRLWLAAHMLHAAVMFLTLFANTLTIGTNLVACLGFSWAMTQWVPFALIATDNSRALTSANENHEYEGWRDDECGESEGQTSGMGAVLGLHNMSMAGPQVIAAILSAGLFKLFDLVGWNDEVGWVLRIAGLAALGAVWASRHLVLGTKNS